MNYVEAIRKVIIAEGGAKITDDKSDSGGLTKYGISQRAYPTLDIRNLTEAQAISIYKKDYWDKVSGDKLPYSVAYALFNMAVNRGVVTAIKNAQKVLGTTQDGIFGSSSLKLISANPVSFLQKFLAEMIEDYKAIASNDGANDKDKKFLNGWLNRITEISDYVGVKPAVAASGAFLLIAGVFFLILLNSRKGKLA